MTITTIEDKKLEQEQSATVVEQAVSDAKARANKAAEQLRNLTVFSTVTKLTRNTLLASLGALVLLRDQFSALTDCCITRGSTVEQDTKDYARKVWGEILSTARLKKEEAQSSVETEETTTNGPLEKLESENKTEKTADSSGDVSEDEEQ
jgi:hypothetical protein